MKIAPGIDVEHFIPTDATVLRNSLGLSDKKVIVSVGRLVHRKGQDHLIEAMPEILKSIPQAHLLLVGEGPYREHLQTLVKKHNLEASVTFIGRIQYKDLPTYICVGDIFAMPSRSRLMGLEVEGLGIKLLTDIELSKRMGHAGRQWIIDNWRWEIWSKDFEKLLNK